MWFDTGKHIAEYANVGKKSIWNNIDQGGNYDNNSNFAGV